MTFQLFNTKKYMNIQVDQVERVHRLCIRNRQRYGVFAVIFATCRGEELTCAFG